MQNDEKRIAVFIDFENVAMGVKESNYGNFDIELVLKRVVEKGKILVKRAYSDWHRYAEFKRTFHQAAIELIDVPQTRYSGKNSADIRMVVDALDLSYQKEHIDTFVLVSGDSDFSPLVSKLRENGRYVIGVGVKQSSSDLLVNNCDEFIYYEDLFRPTSAGGGEESKLSHLPQKRAEAIRLVMETFQALQREGKEVIYGSMVKQTLIRKLPSFNETYYGYPMFSRLLEEAAENKLLRLTKDVKSGGYILTAMSEVSAGAAAPVTPTNGDSGEEALASADFLGAKSASLLPAPPLDSRERSRRGRWGRGRPVRGPQRFGEPGRGPRESAGTVPKSPEVVSEAAPVEPAPVDVAAASQPSPPPASILPEPPVEAVAVTAAPSEPGSERAIAVAGGPESQSRGQGRRSRWERGRRPFKQRQEPHSQASAGEAIAAPQSITPETPGRVESVEVVPPAVSEPPAETAKPHTGAGARNHRGKRRPQETAKTTSSQEEAVKISEVVKVPAGEPVATEAKTSSVKPRSGGPQRRGKTAQAPRSSPKKPGKK